MAWAWRRTAPRAWPAAGPPRRDPGPLLPRHEARDAYRRAHPRAAARGVGCHDHGRAGRAPGVDGADPVDGHRQADRAVRCPAAGSGCSTAPAPSGRAARCCASPAAGRSRSARRVPRHDHPAPLRRQRPRHRRHRAQGLRPRRDRLGDALLVARRRARRAGRRGPVVRARGELRQRPVRRLPRHAQPDVRRRLGRDAEHRRRGGRDGEPGADLQGQGRDDVLLRSSGGRTANVEDIWSGSPIPYLVSVDDPGDAISVYHRWKPRTFTAKSLGQLFGIGPVRNISIVRNKSGRVATLTLTTAHGRGRCAAARRGRRRPCGRPGSRCACSTCSARRAAPRASACSAARRPTARSASRVSSTAAGCG